MSNSKAEFVRKHLHDAKLGITDREVRVLTLYYGLDDGEEHTFEEVGSTLGMTRERARQIRNRALQRMSSVPGYEEAFIS